MPGRVVIWHTCVTCSTQHLNARVLSLEFVAATYNS
jgi:hypothetical protein